MTSARMGELSLWSGSPFPAISPDTEGPRAPGTEPRGAALPLLPRPWLKGLHSPASPPVRLWSSAGRAPRWGSGGFPPFPWVYGCGNLGSFCCPHTPGGIIAALPSRGAASETLLRPASQPLQRGVWGPDPLRPGERRLQGWPRRARQWRRLGLDFAGPRRCHCLGHPGGTPQARVRLPLAVLELRSPRGV